MALIRIPVGRFSAVNIGFILAVVAVISMTFSVSAIAQARDGHLLTGGDSHWNVDVVGTTSGAAETISLINEIISTPPSLVIPAHGGDIYRNSQVATFNKFELVHVVTAADLKSICHFYDPVTGLRMSFVAPFFGSDGFPALAMEKVYVVDGARNDGSYEVTTVTLANASSTYAAVVLELRAYSNTFPITTVVASAPPGLSQWQFPTGLQIGYVTLRQHANTNGYAPAIVYALVTVSPMEGGTQDVLKYHEQ